MRTLFEDLVTDHRAVMFGHAARDLGREEMVTRRVFAEGLDLPAIARVPAAYLEFLLRFRRDLERFRPSLVFAQHELALLGVRQDAPQVLFLRDEALLPSYRGHPGRSRRPATAVRQSDLRVRPARREQRVHCGEVRTGVGRQRRGGLPVRRCLRF